MNFSFIKNRFFLAIFSLIFVVFLNIFATPLRAFFYSFSAPAQSYLFLKGRGISDFFEGFFQFVDIKNMNKEFESENLLLKATIADLQGVKEENKQLTEALNLGVGKEFVVFRSFVISKDISQDVFVVSGGSMNSLEPGMPAITQSKVLAGRIIEVFENTSKVMLLTHVDMSFDVKLEYSNSTALWKGKGRSGAILDLVAKDFVIAAGDQVLTSRLGGIFPGNLLVGKIEKTIQNDAAPFQSAQAVPLFDPRDAEFLFIITSF